MDLTAADLALHAGLGISADLLKRARVRRVSDRETRELLSLNGKAGDFGGIEYPFIHPLTGYRVTSRVRRDHPPLKADGSLDGKYMAVYGDNRHLYFPPGTDAMLADTSVPVIVVESEKAALAIMAAAIRAHRQVLVFATSGCWGWKGVTGKTGNASGVRVDVKGALPDLALITWTNRPTIIMFDARPNASVQAARRELARELVSRGGDVRHAHLPDDDDHINGPDDLVAVLGDAGLWTVIDAAVPHDFARGKKGAIVNDDLDNIRLALLKLDTVLRFNSFTQQVTINGKPADDLAVNQLWVRIVDTFKFRPSKETLRTVIEVDAQVAAFHPVRDYLDRLQWDDVPRLDTWLITYGGAPESEYVRAVGRLPLIAAVRRVRHPGAKFDELLVLESPQGTMKSSALRKLCQDETCFSDDLPLGVDSKHVIERTSGKWILEASELHGNRGRETEQLKAFLSRQVDGPVRLAYGRLPTSVPRQFVMIGTTNSSVYLKDSTGARRFWPVRIQEFDVAALERDRDQIWAEAAAREAQDESIRLDPELWAAAGVHQERRRAGDPWEELLEPLFGDDDKNIVETVSVDAVWNTLGVEANARDNRHSDRVNAIVQRFGFEKKKSRWGDGKPMWHWVRCSERSDQCSEQT